MEKLLTLLAYNPEDPLLFNSGFFLFFLLAFLLVRQVSGTNNKLKIYAFTLFSLYFFYKACGWYVGLVILSAVVDFNLSRLIFRSGSASFRKLILSFSIVINLGLLFYFKYTDFFIRLINDFSSQQINPLNLILPIGISFYTFENISYTIDVYRGHFKPLNTFMEYLFFLSFFPKLVMGPIVRAADFIPQINQNSPLSSENLSKGFYLIASGLFKKVAISDVIQVNLVQYVFDDPARYTGFECLLAVYGYALIIYCDFSGYSDMAIGLCKWLGFDININFLSPYQSASITEFWRRWHISLSSWLRDYLYIPLGGNRNGKFRQSLNLAATMLIGGFWHGANWTFIFWGGLHGLALGLDKLKLKYLGPIISKSESKPLQRKLWRWGGILFTFHLVCLGWVFFKSDSFSTALTLIAQIGGNFSLETATQVLGHYQQVVLVMLVGFGLHAISLETEARFSNLFHKWRPIGYALALSLLILLLDQVKSAEPVMPVYLQF